MTRWGGLTHSEVRSRRERGLEMLLGGEFTTSQIAVALRVTQRTVRMWRAWTDRQGDRELGRPPRLDQIDWDRAILAVWHYEYKLGQERRWNRMIYSTLITRLRDYLKRDHRVRYSKKYLYNKVKEWRSQVRRGYRSDAFRFFTADFIKRIANNQFE